MTVNFSALDQFPQNPSPNIKGEETLSIWFTKICSITVMVGAIFLALPILYHLSMPIDQLPISYGVMTAEGKTIDPYLVLVKYFTSGDVGLVRLVYKNDSSLVQKVACPDSTTLKMDDTECYQTRETEIGQNGGLLIQCDSIVDILLYIEVFSLDHLLRGADKQFQSTLFTQSTLQYVEFQIAQLQIFDSLVDEQPTKVVRQISSFVSLSSDTGKGNIFYGDDRTCPQYNVERLQLTTIVAAWVSWIQTLISVCAVVVPAFNILAMKIILAYYLFSRDQSGQKRSNARLWVAGICDIFYVGFILKKLGWLRREAAYLNVEDKIQFQNLFVVKSFLLQNKIQEESLNNSCSDLVSEQMKTIAVSENAEGFKFRTEKQLSQTVKKHEFLERFQQEPSMLRKVLVGFLTAINANSIKVALTCQHQYKSSTRSVILTVIGVAVVVVILYFIGAFSFNSDTTVQVILNRNNSLTIGPTQNPFYFYVSSDGTLANQIFDDTIQIEFLILDRQYNIVKIHQVRKNCTSNDQDFSGFTYNYCLDDTINIFRTSAEVYRFCIRVVDLNTNYFGITFLNSDIINDALQSSVTAETFILVPNSYQAQINVLKEQTDNENLTTTYKMAKLAPSSNDVCDGGVCFIYSLTREEYQLSIDTGSVISFLSNIWSTTLLVFGLVFVNYISFHNNQTAKVNMQKVIEKSEDSDGPNDKLFGIQNVLASLYSKLNRVVEKKPHLFFIKKRID